MKKILLLSAFVIANAMMLSCSADELPADGPNISADGGPGGSGGTLPPPPPPPPKDSGTGG